MAMEPQAVAVVADLRSAPAHRPDALFFWLWGEFWLLMIAVAVEDSLHDPHISWWEPILWEGSSALVATCWLLVAMWALKYHARYLERPAFWFARYLRWVPLVTIVFVPAVYALRHSVYALAGRTYHHPSWGFVFGYESIKVTLFAGLWLGILFGLDSYAQWQMQRERVLELQKALTETQLARLQAQLRPHFFFNALNTISALMHVDVERADRLVAGLGDLLHISLRSGDQQMTPLREELDSLKLYAQIMQERFRDRVTLNWSVQPGIADVPVPTLLLQPLLENAFKHCVERTTAPVHIDVMAGRQGSSLVLVISNTGRRLAADYREGVGLRNCRERLKAIYGGAAALEVRDESGTVTARVSIPLVCGAA